ncbi:MAG: AMP-binding protein [Bacteroidia bacterium]|jgi:O-succinylbenzoic acid--CoA ligase|nr:AMP-binding protein [Bacteroidia bacterium]
MQSVTIGTHHFSFSDIKEKGKELLTISSVVPFEGDEGIHYFSYAFALAQQWLNGAEAFAFHTSGSTGAPKPIILTRAQLEASANATIQVLGITSNDHIFHCIPTHFIGGAMLLIRGLIAECDITFVEPSTKPIELLPEQHSYTIASFTPMQLYPILHFAQAYEAALGQFKTVLIGGAAIDDLLERKLADLPKVVFYHTYGMTETASHIALRKIGLEKMFHVLPGTEVRVNEEGCLCIKGDITAQQWIETNDLVRMATDTSFEVMGRIDGVINSGGVKIFPTDIEVALGDYLQLAPMHICALGLPDKELGQKLIVFIAGAKELEVNKQVLLKRLKGYQIPKAIYQVEQFPQTVTGKVNRPELLKMIHLAREIPLR